MRSTLLIRLLLASCSILTAPAAMAAFSTYSNKWPDDACVVNEKVTSAQEVAPVKPDTSFIVVTEEQKDQRLSDFKRLYAKIGATFLTADIRSIQNTSLPALSSGVVVNGDAKEDYLSWEFGLGTKFQYVRLEVEYMYEKNVPYNASPLFSNTTNSESITSKLNSQSVWFDLMYDMNKLNLPYFTPYIGGLVGVVWNKTRTALTGTIGTGASQNHSRIGLGWGATFGVRVPFWTRWFGYLGYKYLDHGKVVWQDTTGIMQLKGHYVVQGVDFGVQYLLG